MFLAPFAAVGILLALALGGDIRRIADIRFRASWAVAAALATQAFLFSRLADHLPATGSRPLHLASYGLLLWFVLRNRRTRPLWLMLVGVLLNAVVIAANGGRMPISAGAASAAGITVGANVDEAAHRLWPLGDVFALPRQLPLANTFSVGDICIGAGLAAFIIVASTTKADARILSATRIVRPLRVRAFRLLFAGQFVSILGDWLTLGALIGWLYGKTGSTGEVSALLLVRFAPPIIGSSFAGLITDRVSKNRLLTAVEIGRFAVVATALAGTFTDHRLLIFAAVGVSGCLGAVSSSVMPALIPALLPGEQLEAANAELGLGRNAARAIGALGGGAAVAAAGAPVALAVDLLTFAVAAGLYARLPHVLACRAERPRFRATFAGASHLVRNRAVLVVVSAFAAATIATGLTNATLPRLLEHMGFGGGGYGYGMGALGAGLLLGETFVGCTRVGTAGARWIAAALLTMSGLLALLGLGTSPATALFFLAAIGFVDGTTDVLFDTILQRETDPAHHGSVFGFASAFFTTTMIGAIALAPVLNAVLAPGHVLVGAAAFLVVAGAVAAFGASPSPVSTRAAGAASG